MAAVDSVSRRSSWATSPTFHGYVSTNTDARERQWRHFYYAEDTWRPTSKITVNYGLRLDVINPQSVNKAGNGGWLDLSTGEILIGGVGDVDLAGNVRNRLNWAPRVGVTYQLDEKTVIRGGYGRTYDIGVFGSLFGHSVTQNLPVLSVQQIIAPSNFDRVFTLDQGPAGSDLHHIGHGPFPASERRVHMRESPEQRPPAVDAYNVTVQRQLSDVMSVEVGYVGNYGAHQFVGDGPGVNVNNPTLQGFPDVSRDLRRPFFAGAYPTNGRWIRRGIPLDAGHRSSSATAATTGTTRFRRASTGASRTGTRTRSNYTWQKAEQEDGRTSSTTVT